MRVLLAEDHPMMQERIAALLSETLDLVCVVDRGDQVLDQMLRCRPDAVVLDVSLPGRSGLSVLPELREKNPWLAVVILTTHESPIYQEEAFNRGADAYVFKRNAVQELLPAIYAAISARRCMDQSEQLRA